MAKAERIDLRVQEELKGQFSAAAEASGMNLTTFLIAAAREQAARVLRARKAVVLSDRDRDLFLAALDRAPRPIPDALRKAKERRNAVVVND